MDNTISGIVKLLAQEDIKVEPNSIRDRLKRIYPNSYHKGVAGIIFIDKEATEELLLYYRLKKKKIK